MVKESTPLTGMRRNVFLNLVAKFTVILEMGEVLQPLLKINLIVDSGSLTKN